MSVGYWKIICFYQLSWLRVLATVRIFYSRRFERQSLVRPCKWRRLDSHNNVVADIEIKNCWVHAHKLGFITVYANFYQCAHARVTYSYFVTVRNHHFLAIVVVVNVQLNPGNSNCQVKFKSLRVIGVSSYKGFK